MGKEKPNSPLLGYNTNVKHAGHLFHIQTEDSGREHPHIITHLFTEGTILSSRKTPYDKHLDSKDWETRVKKMMKDQHKEMFVELRDGNHDEVAEKVLGRPLDHSGNTKTAESEGKPTGTGGFTVQGADERDSNVSTVTPASMESAAEPAVEAQRPTGISIFESPDSNGAFGETLISDKSLDDVILNYLSDELEE